MRTRVVIGTSGVLLAGFGAFRLVTQVPIGALVVLVAWLVGAILVHDGLLSPLVVAVGWVIGRVVPDRARRHLQFALIVAALVTLVAAPLIYRQGSQPASKALLRQQYGVNLTILLGIVAVVTLVTYAVQVVRSGRSPALPEHPTPSS